MPVTTQDLQAAFLGAIPMNLKILRGQYRCVSIELLPESESSLHLLNDAGRPITLTLQPDATIGTATLMQGAWDPVKQSLLADLLAGFDEDLTLVDVGANIGLFARQCLNRLGRIRSVHCYEPHPLNFRLLQRNLEGLARVKLHPYGLSDQQGVYPLHLDPENAGNYSLIANAVPMQHPSIQVRVQDAGRECDRWLADGRAILYKSDTQGFDETIACALAPDFWRQVKVAVFELWRLPGKQRDPQRFAQLLDTFPHRMFEKAPQTRLSTAEVLAYLDSTDGAFDDLYAWR